MLGRLSKVLRRIEAEQRRVDEFLAAIRVSGLELVEVPVARPFPVAGVECVDTPHGRVWQLDAATRARRAEVRSTVELPKIVARAAAPLR